VKEPERIVRAYEDALKNIVDIMSDAFKGIEPSKRTILQRRRLAVRLDRIRKRYLHKEY